MVRDTHRDARFADHPLVTGAPHLRFYAGIPLSLDDGRYAAALCVADARPRPDFGEAQVRQLRDAAVFVEAFMQLRLAHDQRARTLQDFQSTLDGMDQGVLTTDADDRVRVSNRRAAELMGVPERLCRVGAPVAAIRDHQTARGEFAHLPDRLRAWLERGEPEMRHPAYERERADGTALHVGTLPVAGGGLVHVITDVSDRRRAERAVQASEARYRTLVEVLPQMVVIACAETGEARYANRCFAEYHGPIGPSLQARTALVHPDDFDDARQAWLPVHLGTGGCTFEARLRRHDGVYRWHKLSAVPIPQGDAATVLCTALDIDEIVTARRELEQTTDLLRLAQEAAGVGIYEWDLRTDRVSLSPAGARMHGLPVPDVADEAPTVITLAAWKACVVPDDLPAVWRAAERNMVTLATNAAEYRTPIRDGAGGHRWVQSLGRAVADGPGEAPTRIVGLHLDVTERRMVDDALRASQERLRVSEERLALALDGGEDGMFDWDLAADAIWVSERWLAKLGHDEGFGRDHTRVRRGSAFLASIHPDDRREVRARLRAHLHGDTPTFEAEYRRRRGDGSYIWVLSRARGLNRDAKGRAQRLVGTSIDISQRKAAELHAANMARHDALTNLPNRTVFQEHLDHVLKRAVRAPGRHAVLVCDLDRFKAVNDTFGHLAGDGLLCVVAERLRAVVRAHDTVARLGGDEFAVILGELDGEAGVRAACERVIAAVGQPIPLRGLSVDVAMSVGAALVSGGDTAEAVFQRADTALYQAKAAGRNTYRLFEAAAHTRAITRSLLALDMREAIRRGDFFLVYQPVVEASTGTVVSFEALMRWQHPVHGLISPGEFIPVAEDIGLIVPLGAWALGEACREALTWPEHVRVGVNVSPVQFRGGLEETVVAALAGTGLPAQRLKLEVTESVLMRDADGALACLHRLRGLGVRIALDDFGTGYSSLSYLRRFPFDKLKIDRAFIRDIADPDAAAIVRAVVGIGERLGMGIVAEGVETEEQLALVCREGCTEVQGFLFSRPLPAEQARAFLMSPCHAQDAA